MGLYLLSWNYPDIDVTWITEDQLGHIDPHLLPWLSFNKFLLLFSSLDGMRTCFLIDQASTFLKYIYLLCATLIDFLFLLLPCQL